MKDFGWWVELLTPAISILRMCTGSGTHSTSHQLQCPYHSHEEALQLFGILRESFSQMILMAANCPAILQLDFVQH